MSAAHCSKGKFSKREKLTSSRLSILRLLAALLIRISMRPKRARISFRQSSRSRAWVISVCRPQAETPNSAASCAAFSGARGETPSKTGTPPARAIARACCSPSSPAPPVIAATRPVKSKTSGIVGAPGFAGRVMVRTKANHAAGSHRLSGGERHPQAPDPVLQVHHRLATGFHAFEKVAERIEKQLVAVEVFPSLGFGHCAIPIVSRDR